MQTILKRLRLNQPAAGKMFNSLLVLLLLFNLLPAAAQAAPPLQESNKNKVFLPLVTSNADQKGKLAVGAPEVESNTPAPQEGDRVSAASSGQGGWDDTVAPSAFDPINRRGPDPVDSSPAGALVQAALWGGPRPDESARTAGDKLAGSSSFQLSVPVVRLAGRGLDLALNLTYRSLLWHKDSIGHGSRITYNIDQDWPAPGWSLDFGRLVRVPVGGGWNAMLVDADGTRHPYWATIFSPVFTAHTTDGALIDYSVQIGAAGELLSGQVRYPNGTVVEYGAPGVGSSTLYPTSITDANGNLITITYRNNSGPQLNTVVDTLGRTINFYYDANNLLTAVTAPGLNSGMRPLIRLHYRQLALQHSFNGLFVRAPSTVWVVDAIYYPGTSTGYWFGDADSYSSYGMLSKVSQRRAMSFSNAPLTEQGTVTAGNMTRQRVYNYPLGPGQPLADAPSYSTMTESWSDMDTSAAVTTYQAQMSANPRRIDVIHPDNSRKVQLSYNIPPCAEETAECPDSWKDGLVYHYESYDANGNLVQQSDITWARDAANPAHYQSPRPVRVEVRDERGQMTATEYSYGGAYNQVTEVREYDYGGATVLRRVRTEYEPRMEYVFRHIFNLPTVVEVYEGSATTPVARTEYTYDGQPLTDTPGVVQHQRAFNPYDPGNWAPPSCRRECEPGRRPPCQNICEPGYWQPVFDPATNHRGNVTQVTTYSNAANRTGAVNETRRYDINGNLVIAAGSCCVQTVITYTVTTQYAYPTAMARGAASPSSVRVTTLANYDFNTGLPLSTTDANGRTTQMTYHAASLRPVTVHLPTSAVISYYYDDAGLAYTTAMSDPSGVTKAAYITQRLNGLGLVRRSEQLAEGEAWDIVDLKYGVLGQLWQQSQPYRNGQTPQWSTFVYDVLGRPTRALAADGSEMRTFYNEATRPSGATNAPGVTMRTVDAWGRERWSRTDALGRLVELVEPNPNGSGSVTEAGHLVTTYSYNAFDQLLQTVQGAQMRRFRYDSLGRLTHQHLPEKQATLNDQGQYGAPNPLTRWSDVFIYDARSNLTDQIDARGVKTRYDYANDPLNRLQAVSYDTTGFGDTNHPILAAAPVSYQYMGSGDVTRLWRVTANGISTVQYGYDVDGRLTEQTLTLASQPAHPLVTTYSYDIFNRLRDIQYPAQYGVEYDPRKVVQHDYDVMSRVKGLRVDGVDYASQLVYNAASQLTSLKVGAGGSLQVTENAEYDVATGLLISQQVLRSSAPLLDLAYGYLRPGTGNGRTGQLTQLTNRLDEQKNRTYTYDALGRLARATGGAANPPLWSQEYTYDRYGNRTGVTASGSAANGALIPRDGLAQVSYDPATNRITSADFVYDAAGNLMRGLRHDGLWQRSQYDAAGRLVKVKDDAGVTLEVHTYGADRRRLITQYGETSNLRSYYAWSGAKLLVEYEATASYPYPVWTKSYVYLGERLLATLAWPYGVDEVVQYHHADRLGTRLLTNNTDSTFFEQVTLPYGVALDAESTGSINPRFTSYQRSATSGLDYAMNRFYQSQQGRFTQVDPLGMGAASLSDPQSLNLYAYVQNDPVNAVDPLGLLTCYIKNYGSSSGYTVQPDGFWKRTSHVDYGTSTVCLMEAPRSIHLGGDRVFVPKGPGGGKRAIHPGSDRSCFSSKFTHTFMYDFKETNGFLFSGAGFIIRTVLGTMIGGALARESGTVTVVQAIRSIVRPGLGPAGVATLGGTGATLGSAALHVALKAALVAGALEVGIVIGSSADALGHATSECMW
jgi:RHS repeat-associated protein